MIFIFNLGPHYNSELYKLIDESIDCSFYLGNKLNYNIELFDYNSLRGFQKELNNIYLCGEIYWQKGVIRLLLRESGKYVITGDPYCLTNWIILIYNRMAKRKTFLWTHGMYGDESGIKKYLKLFFLRLSSGVLLYGNRGKDILLSYHFSDDRLKVIYNSTNYSEQIYYRELAIGYPIFNNKYPVLLFVGRINRRKKINLLIEAFGHLNASGVNCNLLIVGDLVSGDPTSITCRDKNLSDRFRHIGGCYLEKDLSNYFKIADILVVPGDAGLVVIHSMTYGVPVITHNFFESHGPEFEAIKQGITGDFFRKDDLSDLVFVISSWILKLRDQKEDVRIKCIETVDKTYNPKYQLKVLKQILINHEEKQD